MLFGVNKKINSKIISILKYLKVLMVILIILASMLILVKKLDDKGSFIPSYFEWHEKEIYIDNDKTLSDKSDEIENYALDFFDAELYKPIKKLILKNKKIYGISYDDKTILWETPDNYKIQDMFYDDVDFDNENELIIVLWKKGRYGSFLPFYIKSNDMSWDQHIFIYDYKNGKMIPRWNSSYIEVDIKELSIGRDKILTILDKNGGRTRYKWLSWGLTNIKSSKFDYDEKYDKDIEHVKIVAFGDNLIHKEIVDYASDYKMNFNFLYDNILNELSDADIKVINEETPLVENDISYFPKFASPIEVGDAIVDAGFNVITLANNHIYDQKEKGLNDTLNFYAYENKKRNSNKPSDNNISNRIITLGVTKKNEEAYKILECKGIKFSLFNYTYALNDLSTNEILTLNINSLINEKQVKRDLNEGVRKSDLSIVFVHFGDEYKKDISRFQRYWAKIFLEKGVDIVIGTHPHILQDVEVLKDNNGNEMLIYYSLGNFVSNQTLVDTLFGGEAKIEIVKTNNGIKIKNYELKQLITHNEYVNINGIRNNYVTTYTIDDYNDNLLDRHIKKADIKKYMNENSLELNGSRVNSEILYEVITKENYKEVFNKNCKELIKFKNKIGIDDIRKLEFGNRVSFGKYEQDGNEENGKEDIIWRYLGIKGDIAYFESEKIIDISIYDNNKARSFNDSYIHHFLNTKFIDDAFNEGENNSEIYDIIKKNSVTLDCTYRFEKIGIDIEDNEFFKCEVTNYVKNKYSSKGIEPNNDYWLLNLCDETRVIPDVSKAKYINDNGIILEGDFKNVKGVRPFLKIDIKT